MKSVIIFGTNDVSQLAAFYLENDSDRKVHAFCVDREHWDGRTCVFNKPVVFFEEQYDLSYDFFVPLYDNNLRFTKAEEVKKRGFNLISYISSKATNWSTKIGENCFIMEDNTIQPFVEIGDNVIMWSGNHIGHHTKIRDNVFISSHVVICGNCKINSFCWLGVNSSVKDGLVLETGTLLGMGSVVIENTEPNKSYMGCPAKEYKNVKSI